MGLVKAGFRTAKEARKDVARYEQEAGAAGYRVNLMVMTALVSEVVRASATRRTKTPTGVLEIAGVSEGVQTSGASARRMETPGVTASPLIESVPSRTDSMMKERPSRSLSASLAAEMTWARVMLTVGGGARASMRVLMGRAVVTVGTALTSIVTATARAERC